MIKIGITGQSGFVGTNLYNYLGLKEKVERVLFKDLFFESTETLENFVKKCDVIVHLAAINRHIDPQVIYDTNIKLVQKLISALEQTNSKPQILFSSSTQEKKDNLYGKSKYDGRKLFENWAIRNNTRFTGFIITNVFGPFGIPYYNSFIATFCHQLINHEQPEVKVDGKVKLIYVLELIDQIYDQILIMHKAENNLAIIDEVNIEHTVQIKVSETLKLLKSYKENYFEKGIVPKLDNEFEKNLYNTFLCYIDHKTFFPYNLQKHTDDRGSFVELIKLNSGGQVSFSITRPGITRGNHFHTRKAERFAVIKGKARIKLRKIGTKEILSFNLDGYRPSFVDIPIWYTHNITNTGDEDLYTIFWINEHYNPEDGDTFFENV